MYIQTLLLTDAVLSLDVELDDGPSGDRVLADVDP
jgi:hypothetical protein